MFRGYNLEVDENEFDDFYDCGRDLHKNNKANIKKSLDSFRDLRGNLLASEITANWFPEVGADVFLSHSHRDSELAIAFSGWLYQIFNIKSFLDSCVWGYSDELLEIIDKEYCYQADRKTFNYDKRNRSTSHVHMMLSTALAKMINKSECVIFLNTPNAINAKDYIKNGSQQSTNSPWIYSEIAMISLIQKRMPDAHRSYARKGALDSAMESANLSVQYDIDVSHLTQVGLDDMLMWGECSKKGYAALDWFYQNTSGTKYSPNDKSGP